MQLDLKNFQWKDRKRFRIKESENITCQIFPPSFGKKDIFIDFSE